MPLHFKFIALYRPSIWYFIKCLMPFNFKFITLYPSTIWYFIIYVTEKMALNIIAMNEWMNQVIRLHKTKDTVNELCASGHLGYKTRTLMTISLHSYVNYISNMRLHISDYSAFLVSLNAFITCINYKPTAAQKEWLEDLAQSFHTDNSCAAQNWLTWLLQNSL